MAITLKNLEVAAEQLLTTILAISTYLLAGKAKLTVHNVRTGVRHTYRVTVVKTRTKAGGYKAAHGVGPWLVEVHTAEGWAGLGYIRRSPFRGGVLQFLPETYGRKLPVVLAKGDVRSLGMAWLVKQVRLGAELPEFVQVWHHGQCGRCARDLISEYRMIGYGPVCCKALRVDARAIFARLAELGEAPLNARIAAVRELVHGDLSSVDKEALRLLPGVVGEYAKAHLDAA